MGVSTRNGAQMIGQTFTVDGEGSGSAAADQSDPGAILGLAEGIKRINAILGGIDASLSKTLEAIRGSQPAPVSTAQSTGQTLSLHALLEFSHDRALAASMKIQELRGLL